MFIISSLFMHSVLKKVVFFLSVHINKNDSFFFLFVDLIQQNPLRTER